MTEVRHRRKRTADMSQLAASIVWAASEGEKATGDKMSERGRKGGVTGGRARSERLTHEPGQEISAAVAAKRWAK